MLSKKHKINRKLFSNIKQKKGRVYHSPFFTLHIYTIDKALLKFSIVVSHKISKKATLRNKIKRTLFTSIEKNKKNMTPGFAYIFYLKKLLKKADIDKGFTDWRPVADKSVLRQRADLYDRIREFMRSRTILEVDTPCLSAAGTTDPNIHSLFTFVNFPNGDKQQFYLNTSPEFAMKRLLADGTGPVYQISKVFRDEESGKLHNPEFTMLEWYRPGFDYRQLMEEVQALLLWLGLESADFITYADLFAEKTGLNPHTCDKNQMLELAVEYGLASDNAEHSEVLDFLFNNFTQARIGEAQSFFVYDYPVCQAALASIREDEHPVAERFELFINGIEIANGFQELNNSTEQRQRFMHENNARNNKNLAEVSLDERFLASLEYLPDCSGVAMGLDRLLMCMTGHTDIREVLVFPVNRS